MYDTADTDSESECTTVTDHTFMWKENIEQERFAEIYRTAMIIKSEINSTPGLAVWPPMAQNLSMEKCSDAVPSSLFNFLAWCCGVAENFNTERVDVQCHQNKRRILSLAQDLITLASQGRKLMPKQVALGMTVRHLTGSAKLQQLLNSFGHCVSHSFTLEHDTALATKQLESTGDIPEGFQGEEFKTLVWDNNDFGEETLTGKATTHNTNGIIIQRQLDINSHPSEARNPWIYRLCLQNTTAPNPVDHGWKVKDNELTIKWTTLPIAPDSVLQVVNCGCKKPCDSLRCSCRKAGMDCTDMCKCCECLNRQLVSNDGDLFDTQSDDPDSEFDC